MLLTDHLRLCLSDGLMWCLPVSALDDLVVERARKWLCGRDRMTWHHNDTTCYQWVFINYCTTHEWNTVQSYVYSLNVLHSVRQKVKYSAVYVWALPGAGPRRVCEGAPARRPPALLRLSIQKETQQVILEDIKADQQRDYIDMESADSVHTHSDLIEKWDGCMQRHTFFVNFLILLIGFLLCLHRSHDISVQ